MKRIAIIGIGAGDPEHITIQAINALNRVDVFFLLEKGEAKSQLIELRKEICRRYIAKDRVYRFADATSPDWARDTPDYRATVDDLNRDKQAVFERLFATELKDGECGAFLVWGDPSLYDSTIRIVETIVQAGTHDIEFEVIAGISSIQALAARCKTTLNSIGGAVAITTGRRLSAGWPEGFDNAAVMLDARDAYKSLAGRDVDIHWGAYVGMKEEIVISGKLADVADEIARVRAEARREHGWIMDSYLLRLNDGGDKS
ncbi:MAG: precorrin-6A synthase (deacetylating) [Alphaproteobacteria bacterium]|nr:precorrin-6A synthase (deacetylating) [Alphaproteobacteria bacterium]